MSTCKTCKHWTKSPLCASPALTRECKSLLLIHESMYPVALEPRQAQVACDEYTIRLYTGPDFGCVNHEAKDSPP
ncbi:MAG: hypothetical protein HY369_02775 [Candidatus Aenigmarchaeota archaeon]|nr:hypothetical protein [Candidatus Aenigmarchaeota archaeon]